MVFSPPSSHPVPHKLAYSFQSLKPSKSQETAGPWLGTLLSPRETLWDHKEKRHQACYQLTRKAGNVLRKGNRELGVRVME